MTKIFVFLIIVLPTLSWATQIKSLSGRVVSELFSESDEIVKIESVEFLNPDKKFSCNHVEYRVLERKQISIDYLKSARKRESLDKRDMVKLKTTGTSFYKNLLADDHDRFYRPVFRVSISVSATEDDVTIVNTPFSFDFAGPYCSADKLTVYNDGSNTRVAFVDINYLDICLGYKLNIATASCLNLSANKCELKNIYALDTSPLRNQWQQIFNSNEVR